METNRTNLFYVLAALMLALGISIGGYFIGNMLYKSKIATNMATVKGLAEREVKANVASWNISFDASNANLKLAFEDANASKAKVTEYLTTSGFAEEEISSEALRVSKEEHRDDKGKLLDTSYHIYGSVNVRSEHVDKISVAAQKVGDLVGEGVLINYSSPQYMFTKLNDIKPEMLGEATRNARIAAEQFAKDANAKVGSINSAEQGAFNFSARDAGENGGDETASIYKKVRVVTTISFYLKD